MAHALAFAEARASAGCASRPPWSRALRAHGHPADEALLPYLLPLGWEHLNLTGDYSWRTKCALGKFRPLRPFAQP